MIKTQDSLLLNGKWRFSMDYEDAGIKEQWCLKELEETIELPGILQNQGYGDDISITTPWNQSLFDKLWFLRKDYKKYAVPGNVKVPFLSQPPKHYLGAAWYQRDIDIKEEWTGKRIVLNLERTRWQTTVWIDDDEKGSLDSLCVPHTYDLGILTHGKHRLTIRIDNRTLMPYRPDAHSVSDAVGNSWNGIAGEIKLYSTTPVWIDNVQVYTDYKNKSAKFKIKIGNITNQAGNGTISIAGNNFDISWCSTGGDFEYEVSLGENVQCWDEFNPSLQHVQVKLLGDNAEDTKEVTFGVREFETQGSDFILNGRKVYFRGTHDGGCFPLTGYPATDVASWKKIIRTCQDWGLNFIRFHSFCPPEAAFIAADELGFYLQPECGMWNIFQLDGEMENRLYEETERIINAYGNHPSFLLFSPSNEPAGNWKECLPKWVEEWRAKDSRRLYTAESGWAWPVEPSKVEGTDYLYMHRSGFGSRGGTLRGKTGWFGKDYNEAIEGVKMPVLAHELGQWCSYPDYEVMKKFTGYLKPYNYEIFKNSLEAHGMMHKNKDFAMSSGKLQAAIYKEEIEANLRTEHLKGFELLDLHDYLGQGTALVGILDAFWEEKGYISKEAFKTFCNKTVPLARINKRVFTSCETLEATVEISHYGSEPIIGAEPYWKLINSNKEVVSFNKLPKCDIPLGKNFALGNISQSLLEFTVPMKYTLEVGIENTDIKNSWELWIYPSKLNTAIEENRKVVKSLKEAEEYLAAGLKVLYLPHFSQLDWTCPALDPLPVFWNKHMGPTWARTLGICCDPKHPALASFPTEDYLSWQWIEIIKGARGINLDNLPQNIEPIVQPIDDWNRNYKLGLVFEAKVGNGKLLICSADIENDLDKRPAARQFKHSLLNYMSSEKFDPKDELTTEDIQSFLFDTSIMKRANAKIYSKIESEEYAISDSIDGDPNTYWLAGDFKSWIRHPYEIEISFPSLTEMSGIVYMPRQNHRDHEGAIKDYLIQISTDGKDWIDVMKGEFESSFDPKKVIFTKKVEAAKLKLIALSGFGYEIVHHWSKTSKGWYCQTGPYEDNSLSIGEIAVICPNIANTDSSEGLSIEYKEVKTATTDIDQ